MALDRSATDKIKRLLQDADVQRRIHENTRKGREDAKVTIGRVSELFGLKQAKLRELDALLQPERSKDAPTGQRRYSLIELRKLAVISELIKENCTVAEISAHIDEVWEQTTYQELLQEQEAEEQEQENSALPFINQRIEQERKYLFWRYFASRVLRNALFLICETQPDTTAGLILPWHKHPAITAVEDLPKLGEVFVGWLSRSRSSHTLLVAHPEFEYPTDYRLLPLTVMNDDHPLADATEPTLILLDRRSTLLTLTEETVDTIRHLLKPLYEHIALLRQCFGIGLGDLLEPSTDFESAQKYRDIILDGLADMIVALGRQRGEASLWRFCNILLPNDSSLPLLQQSLAVRARSQYSPHRIDITISPTEPIVGISLRAFQSGRVIYRPNISSGGAAAAMIALGEQEGNIRSAIALPVGSEDGNPLAVIYVTADEPDAFPISARRLLRIMGKLVEELLRTFQARLDTSKTVNVCVEVPDIVDRLFQKFLSEDEFYRDIDVLLSQIFFALERRSIRNSEGATELETDDEVVPSTISIIAIEIDNLSIIAHKFGDAVLRRLSEEVGMRIQSKYRALFTQFEESQPYYTYGSRFYLLLKSVPLEEARTKADLLRTTLAGTYVINVSNVTADLVAFPGTSLELPSITVHVGVACYPRAKLEEVLQRYLAATAISSVRTLITNFLDDILKNGQKEGGNVVMSWDPSVWGMLRWSPSQ